jgi:hypothetical protein
MPGADEVLNTSILPAVAAYFTQISPLVTALMLFMAGSFAGSSYKQTLFSCPTF